METRARFVLIGGFTLLGLIGGLVFLLWLAKVELDRTYAQYDILFDTVAGLSPASAVRYNGVDVGKVLTIALDRGDPSLVRVRIEVSASTPVRADTVATLSGQGVTGVSFVGLAGGDAGAPRLERIPPATVAVIRSEPSVVQGLMDDVPDLLAQANALIVSLNGLATPDNRAAVATILANVATASDRLDALVVRADGTLVAATDAATQARAALAKIDAVLAQAEVTLAQVQSTLAQAEDSLTAAESAFAGADAVIRDDVPGIIDRLAVASDRIAGAAGGVQDFSQTGLAQFAELADDARRLVADLSALTNRISADPGRFLLGDQTPEYRRGQ